MKSHRRELAHHREPRAWVLVAAVLSAALCAAAAAAQPPAGAPPAGYFPIDELGILDPETVSVDINLNAAMLRLVSAAVFEEEPELSGLVNELESLRVLVAPADAVSLDRLEGGIARGVTRLELGGWQRVVRVREGAEQTHIYLKEAGGRIGGLTILSVDPADEVVLVNLAGIIDLEQIGHIGRAFDVGSVEGALGALRAGGAEEERPEPEEAGGTGENGEEENE